MTEVNNIISKSVSSKTFDRKTLKTPNMSYGGYDNSSI